MMIRYQHSAAIAALLNLAFARGSELCDECGGYTFKVRLRNGATFEGAPEAASASDVGPVLALMSGEFIVAHEIAAIAVIPFS